MKYIRTKDGIFAYNDLRVRLTGDYIHERVADTIEELVDEYVRVHKTTNVKPMICDKELAISSSKYPSCYDVYGSIWVGADLLSKAKMNDKGELELL